MSYSPIFIIIERSIHFQKARKLLTTTLVSHFSKGCNSIVQNDCPSQHTNIRLFAYGKIVWGNGIWKTLNPNALTRISLVAAPGGAAMSSLLPSMIISLSISRCRESNDTPHHFLERGVRMNSEEKAFSRIMFVIVTLLDTSIALQSITSTSTSISLLL